MGTSTRIVTLLTDFGLRDQYVAAMKGVMLGVNPDLKFVDISHLVPPQDIYTGAFILGQAYQYFPSGTIHVVVVDPGVGTARQALAVSAGTHYFVAPNNGLLSYVFSREDSFEAHHITADHYFHKPVSSTFHGRDIFAPVAGWISRDCGLSQLGPRVKQLVRLNIPTLTRVRDTLIQGAVLAVDNFGNLITNFTPVDVPAFCGPHSAACKLIAGQREVSQFRGTFGEGAQGELFVITGSSGYLEIVMRGGSAAAELRLSPGAPVAIILG